MSPHAYSVRSFGCGRVQVICGTHFVGSARPLHGFTTEDARAFRQEWAEHMEKSGEGPAEKFMDGPAPVYSANYLFHVFGGAH